jgi:spermidine synthase
VVPTYVGGFMAMGWASLDPAKRTVDEATLRRRYEASGIETRYYSPELHRGAFALPNFVRKLVG